MKQTTSDFAKSTLQEAVDSALNDPNANKNHQQKNYLTNDERKQSGTIQTPVTVLCERKERRQYQLLANISGHLTV